MLAVSLPSGTKEEYLITLPRLRIDVLWYGSPYIELAETSYTIGGGHVSLIEYKGQGYFSGKLHSFRATVTPMPGMDGQGRGGDCDMACGTRSASLLKVGVEIHDVHAVKEVSLIGGGEGGEMGDFEARKLWALVAKGIREGDFETASKEKSRIQVCSIAYWLCYLIDYLLFVVQNEQRQRKKDEQVAGTTWELKHPVHRAPGQGRKDCTSNRGYLRLPRELASRCMNIEKIFYNTSLTSFRAWMI